MKVFLYALLLLSSSLVFAQNAEEHKPLTASGYIPEDIRKLSYDKFKDDLGNVDKKSADRKSTEEFLLMSNYRVDELLQSGKILFNDPISEYCEKILDEILKDDADTRAKIRVYTIRSSIANAFATNQGILFVTVGLMAQLENEAQLAFVLAHEVSHFKEKHTLNSYLENQKIIKGKGEYRHYGYNESIKLLSQYSKDKEFEADELGSNVILNTDYSIEEINYVFDVLQYSYLPFDEIPFDKTFFNDDYLKIPDEFFLDSIYPIVIKENYDDSESTHPNIVKRKERVKNNLKDKKGGDKLFIVSEEDFNNVRNISRYELLRLNLLDRNYPKALYNSYLLSLENPDDKYIKTSIAKALYGMAKYKNAGRTSEVLTYYKKIHGESQQVYKMLHSMKSTQINVIALKYNWIMKKQYPDEAIFTQMCDDLFDLLVIENEKEKSYFLTKKEIEKAQNSNDTTSIAENDIKEEENKENKRSKKYIVIDERRSNTNKESESKDENKSSFEKFALADLLEEGAFENEFNDRLEKLEKKKKEEEEEENMSYAQKKSIRHEEQKEKKKQERKGKALGIDKIAVIDPMYLQMDSRNNTKYINSEKKLLDFNNTMITMASDLGLSIELVTPKEFTIDAINYYNIFSLLNDWAAERFDHEDMEFVQSTSDLMEEVKKELGTKYILYNGVISYKQKKSDVGYYFCGAILYPLILPYAIVYALTPEYWTYYYNYLFDIENGNAYIADVKDTKQKDHRGLVLSNLYHTFNQIKRNRTK